MQGWGEEEREKGAWNDEGRGGALGSEGGESENDGVEVYRGKRVDLFPSLNLKRPFMKV